MSRIILISILAIVVLSTGLVSVFAAHTAPSPTGTDDHCLLPAGPGVDWSFCDKTFLILTFADLAGANLAGASLRNADLTETNLREANLSGANLRYANLYEANIPFADLSDADLTGASLIGADFAHANLSGAKLNQADLSGVSNLREANLSGADLYEVNLTDAYLPYSDLTGVDLTKANLRNADLTGADLTGAKLNQADLSFADLTGAKLSGADMTCSNHPLCTVPVIDTDGDGMLDNVDQCPTQAETVNGFEDSDGCPDTAPIPDTDGDGMLDNVDQCPSNPENYNNFEDSDGCPDTAPTPPAGPPDFDKDSIPDISDNCTSISNIDQRNTDGDALGDACDTDDDNDSIHDKYDQCPAAAENLNGFQDSDGCPDVPPVTTPTLENSTIQTDKQIYESDGKNPITITSTVDIVGYSRVNPVVELILTGPEVVLTSGIKIEKSGSFTHSFSLLPNEIKSGKYSVSAKYSDQDIKPVEFGIVTIQQESSILPETTLLSEDSVPSIQIAGNRAVKTTNPDGVFIEYHATVTDVEDVELQAECKPKSGSLFSVGTTKVICVVTDSAGNRAIEEFPFTVEYERQNINSININNTNTNINTNQMNSTDQEGNPLDDWTSIIAAIVTAVVGGVGAIVVKMKKQKKDESVEDSTNSEDR